MPYEEVVGTDKNAFIFSLVNTKQAPIKIGIDFKKNNYVAAIHSDKRFGPVFGDRYDDVGHDIFISNYSNVTYKSYSGLGASFKHPLYEVGSEEANSFLAGTTFFKVNEIEVFQKCES
jgi:hypothetical protein